MKKVIVVLLSFVVLFFAVNLNIENVKAEYSNDSVVVEKIRDLGGVNGLYSVDWRDRGGRVSFYVTVYNGQIINVSEVGYAFWGATVNSAELKIDNPKQATYYFGIENIADYAGVTEYLRVSIDSSNEIVATFK